MIRRILVKLMVACALGAAFFVACIAGAAYCALRPPNFYADLLEVEPAAGAAEAAKEHLEQARNEFLIWHAQTATTQHARLTDSDLADRLGQERARPEGDRGRSMHAMQISEADLNALFASEESRLGAGDLHDRRIAFADGRVRFACTLTTAAGQVVLSAAFVPQPPTDDQVRMEITGANVGRLPLPLAALARWFPKRVERMSGNLYLDTTGDLPQLVLRMDEQGELDVAPTAIKCEHGVLSVEWATAAPAPR